MQSENIEMNFSSGGEIFVTGLVRSEYQQLARF
jgi:hypothetical protein